MEAEIEIIKPKKINWKKKITTLFVIFLLCSVAFFGVRAYTFTKEVITSKSNSASPYLAKSVDSWDNISGDDLSTGDRRINILLLGIGGGNHPGALLTDSMLVASIDPKNKEIAMLSVPRDLYVNIKGFGYQKINATYALGDDNYKNDDTKKFELVKNTVSDFLGIPIHYFGLLNFDGFTKVIDIIGGVDVNVSKDLYDPYFPDDSTNDTDGYDPLYIKVGQHHFDGVEALKYARSRETTSDFDRSRRQQEIMLAVKDKTLSASNLMSISRVSQVISVLQDNLKTDLQISDIQQLMKLVSGIDKSKITSKVLDDGSSGLLYSDSVDGMYVLRPTDSSLKQIHEFVQQYFKDPFIVAENSTIAITDGANSSYATKIAVKELTGFGYDVSENIQKTSDKKVYKKTIIYDYSGGKKKFTLQSLKGLFNGASVISINENNKSTDFEVVIGEDYLANQK